MTSLNWIVYLIIGGLLLWVFFAIRLSIALKKRSKQEDEEEFEKRDN